MADHDVADPMEAAAVGFEKDMTRPTSLAVDRFPPNAQETLTKMGIATMIYQHGMSILNASYDKTANKFVISSENALFVATMFLAKAFDQEGIIRRFSEVVSQAGLPNTYTELEALPGDGDGSAVDFL